MRKASTEMPEQGTQTPSPFRTSSPLKPKINQELTFELARRGQITMNFGKRKFTLGLRESPLAQKHQVFFLSWNWAAVRLNRSDEIRPDLRSAPIRFNRFESSHLGSVVLVFTTSVQGKSLDVTKLRGTHNRESPLSEPLGKVRALLY